MLKTARDFLEYIIEGKRLTRKDSYSLMRGLMEGEFTSSQMEHSYLLCGCAKKMEKKFPDLQKR